MHTDLAVGMETSARITVDQARLATFMGEQCWVYSTPRMVLDIETVCREFLFEHLEPGKNSVGARIEVDHLAPTLPGMAVEITAKVTEIKGKVVSFEVSVRDSVEQVGRARHVRVIVDVEATVERLRRKQAKAESLKL